MRKLFKTIINKSLFKVKTRLHICLMKKLIYTLIGAAALFSTTSAFAQKADTAKGMRWMHHKPEGAFQLQVGYRKADIGQLNNALNANGAPAIAPSNIWINASMFHVFNSWIVEDGLGFSPTATSNFNDIKVKYNQYQLFWRTGYNLSSNPSFRFYPFVGVNFSAAMLKVEDRTGVRTATDLSGELFNNTKSKTLWQPNFGIDLGLGYDFLIKMSTKQMDCFSVERNIPIGIRAGYYINAYAGDWKIDDYKLSNSPDKQSAFFATLTIGLGYKVTK